ncbi:right-handed parallel beta-helix repeat-containing protein [Azospirillum sp.]|uniref:right-handed parallel beta-helix repeat-containing protein n=1 Tax=Azospirillum sp. TaxID=34012 RepID=UPI003D7394A2
MTQASSAAFFVSPNGNDSWSGRLAAPNADGTDGPFATLARARDAMRGSDVKVTYLRGGTFQLASTLELGGADSGVAFYAFPGETPVISGGERVGGFVDEGGGRYSAAVSRATGLDLSIGGVRQTVAQSGDVTPGDPRSGWLVLDQAASGPSTTAIRWRDGDVDPAVLQAGLKIQTFSTDRLADSIVDVRAIDAASRTISFQQAVWYAPKTGGTYRLLNAPNLIRDAGEFAWRASDGRLVVKPSDPGALLAQGAVVARLGTLVALNGASGVTLSGLTFADGVYTGAALTLTGGGGNAITGNRFVNVGTAVRLAGSSGNSLLGNRMEQLGASGVELTPGSNANRVESNIIRDIGRVSKYVGGVMASGAADNVIAHNDIAGSPRYGISFKNWDGNTVNTGNQVLYNRISSTLQETGDGAAIEVLGRSNVDTRMLIQGNWIDGVGGLGTDGNGGWYNRHKSFGIYLDDQANGVTVRDNFIRDTGWASVFVHGGDNNTIDNNIAVTANPGERFIRLEWQPNAGDAGRLSNNVVTRNAVQTSAGNDYWTLLTPGSFQLDGNVLSGGRAYGGGDRVADPGFLDAGGGNYALRAGGLALAMGLHDLAWANMGVQWAGPSIPTPQVPPAPVAPGPATPGDPAGLNAALASFDALSYLAVNPDLAAAFGTDTQAARQHFIAYGYREGRGTSFDGLGYLASYADLAAAFGTDTAAAARHYIGNGRAEGRAIRFDGYAYLATYPDLMAAFGADAGAATLHYIRYGRAEGRGIGFDAYGYLASNGDLAVAFGTDAAAAARHYVTFGQREGRATHSFDALRYLASNRDLAAVFGTDATAAELHYLRYGRSEGRTATAFDAGRYLAAYPDLASAFGGDQGAATRHFLEYGRAEGRTAGFAALAGPA